MKLIYLLMASVLFSLTCNTALAQSNFQVLTESSGLKKIKVTDQSKAQIFSNSITQNAESANRVQVSNTGIVVSVNSLRGLKAAGLPMWIESEALTDFGYGSWFDVPDAQLDVVFDAVTYDVDAIMQVAYEDLLATGTASAMTYAQQLTTIQAQGFNLKKCFSSSWKEDGRTFDKVINNSSGKSYSTSSGYISLNAQANITATGTLKAGFYYKAKTRCGIAYKIQFKYADVNADANIAGTLKSTGSASYSDSKIMNLDSIQLFKYTTDWWFYIFEFNLELKAQLDLGLKIAAAASANYEANYDAKGIIGLTWKCTRDECTKSRNEVNFAFNDTGATTYSAQLKIEVVPFADANFTADLDMYYGALDIANAKIGVVAATPITYFGYYGNQCSDADKNGTNETVSASLIDGYGMLYAYLDLNALGKKKRIDIDLNLGSSWRKTSEFDIRTTTGTKLTMYSKHLYYKDLNGQSSVIQPVFLSDASIAANQSFNFSKRSCHPFNDNVIFEVNWGDGTSNTKTDAANISHNWSTTGSKTIYARIAEDAFGRKLNGQWISKIFTVTPVSGASTSSTPTPSNTCAASGLAGKYAITGYGQGIPYAASQAAAYCGSCYIYSISENGGTAFYCRNPDGSTAASSIASTISSQATSSISGNASCLTSGRSGIYFGTGYSSGTPSVAQNAAAYCGTCGIRSVSANGGTAFYCN